MQDPPSGALVILDIGTTGQRLAVVSGGPGQMWDAWITVEAYPFSGVIKTILTAEDVEQYRSALGEFDAVGHATLGGHRAPEIVLDRDGEVVEVQVTPSGDDPWPTIKYLILPSSKRPPNLVTFPNT